jgi:NOL1/NOP2/sun family putative RNA methylase
VTGLRVNTLKLTTSEYTLLSPYQITSVPWCSCGFVIDSDDKNTESTTPGRHPYHVAGLYYLQEPSAMAAAELLAPLPGECVLDLCAAPGGKATHLAAMMGNKGLLVANEIHPRRVWDLAENLERNGVTNAIIVNETPERLANHFPEFFDRVLVDAPCSGEGMFRKSEIARQEWKPQLPQSCAFRQAGILDHAALLVKPGGQLAYSTCTFSVEENESVVVQFLHRNPGFELLSIPHFTGFQPARPEWIGLSPSHPVSQAIRIWPHLARAEGHFLALFIKNDSIRQQARRTQYLSPYHRVRHKRVERRKTIPCLDDFILRNLNLPLVDSRLLLDGSYVYYVPEFIVDLSGIKVIHPGWWLGSIHIDRFTPSHALAMGIEAAQAKRTLPLTCNDPLLQAYLAGSSIPDAGADGWVLLTVDGYPIGWGKRVRRTIKNYYPRGLRTPA